MVVSGDASPVVGLVGVTPALHVNVLAPVATKLAVWPEQMVSEFTLTEGTEITVTLAKAVLLHVLLCPVTV